MSGVYIKGMKMPIMPKNLTQGEAVPYIDVRIFANGKAVTSKGERPYYTEYHAIPIPPHGRLVDADAFERANQYFWNRDFINPKYEDTLGDLINDAPTIIPADKDGEP